MTAKRGWSYCAGKRGRNRVRVFEHPECGILFVEYYERDLTSGKSKRIRCSLGHRDTREAEKQADQIAAAMLVDLPDRATDITLGRLFDIYEAEVSGTKGKEKQAHDKRTARMLLQFFGKDRKAHSLNVRDVSAFISKRREGTVGPSSERKRRVRNRQIEYDLKFLMAVLNWGTKARESGRPLIDRHPLSGIRLPKEQSPHRPRMSNADYSALIVSAEEVDWRLKLALVLAHETGHRIGAITKLRWSDVDFEKKNIRWREDNDKAGREHVTPILDKCLEALTEARSHRLAVGDAWIFPAPRKPDRPCSRDQMARWFRKAADLAGVQFQPRTGFHSLRRKFASDYAHVPLALLCALGGWKDHRTIIECYQQPDEDEMRSALSTRNGDGDAQPTHQSTHAPNWRLEGNC